LFVLPLAWLDYRWAFLVWNLVGLVVLAATVRLVVRELGWSLDPTAVLLLVAALMAWSPLWNVVEHGQSGLVLLGLLAVGWRALRRRGEVHAGIALGTATALKVHPGLLLLYLVLTRRWCAFVVATATILVLIGLTTAIAGADAWTRFATLGLPELRRWWPDWKGVSLTAFVTRLLMPDERSIPIVRSPELAGALIVVGTLAVLGVTALMCKRDRAGLDRGFALVTTAALLVSTVAWPHYFVVLLLPLALVLGKPPARDRRWLAGLVVCWLLMNVPQAQMAARLIGTGPASAPFVLTVLSANFYGLAGFFVWQVQAWRRAAPARSPSP
jgi:alpha-1,2-mannosyltransferase